MPVEINRQKKELPMKQMIEKVKLSQSALQNDLDMLIVMIEIKIRRKRLKYSEIAKAMNKSRFYVNAALSRKTTKPEVIIEIAEVIEQWQKYI